MYVQDISQGDTNNYGLGINGNYEGITADQEYELQPGEYLLINYTSTSTDDSGTESSTVVNKVYPAGTYIRPNFKLIDSATSHSSEGVSYSKKTGYNFTGIAEGNPDGLFSLSANEQIEIIEPVVVDLGPGETSKSSIVNVYWVRNDDSVRTNNASKTLTFS